MRYVEKPIEINTWISMPDALEPGKVRGNKVPTLRMVYHKLIGVVQ